MRADLVSILIPVFNRESLIRQTVQSALAQTYAPIEVVVVDNASTDGTWAILSELAAADGRLRIFRNAENMGPVRNWLACVDKASGRYAKILWSDDLIHPQFLERLLPTLQDDSVGLAYSAVNIFSDADPEAGRLCYAGPGSGRVNSDRFIEGLLLNDDFPVSPGCAVFRTADLRENLLLQIPNGVGSDFSMHAIGNDLLLFLLTARRYEQVALFAEPLSYFREHAGSITVSSISGKIPLHYDLAKAYFVESEKVDLGLARKLNTLFVLHWVKYRASEFGIGSLADFYPSKRHAGVSVSYLLNRLIKSLVRRISA